MIVTSSNTCGRKNSNWGYPTPSTSVIGTPPGRQSPKFKSMSSSCAAPVILHVHYVPAFHAHSRMLRAVVHVVFSDGQEMYSVMM